MLLLDGVYTGGHDARDKLRFQRVKAPDRAELEQLVYTISERTGRYLERLGLLVRDMDNSYLALEPAEETGLVEALGRRIEDIDAPLFNRGEGYHPGWIPQSGTVSSPLNCGIPGTVYLFLRSLSFSALQDASVK